MKPKLAVTMGDAAGIGAEITLKALAREGLRERCVPVVIGDLACMEDARRITGLDFLFREVGSAAQAADDTKTINLINPGYLKAGDWTYGQVGAKSGDASFRYIEQAIRMTQEGLFDAVVTGPINKEAINLAGHHFSGHTEIFAHFTGTKKYAMLLVGGGLRVIHVSTHVSMRDACSRATKERVLEVIRLGDAAMRLLGIHSPKIGVAGLNAHCSENGLFGTEEADSIIPAVEEAQKLGMDVTGPVPPDTVFVKALSGMFDVVVVMYHDQGHIPVKLCGFRRDEKTGLYTSMSGINCTIGLPFIRTSVDHGTAYGKAGKGTANEDSMVEAIEAAITMSENLSRVSAKPGE